jgi:hypothetical protein
MEQVKVLLFKFLASMAAFAVGLDLFFDAGIGDIFSFSIATTIITYILADRILLSRIGKTNTLLAEFILTYSLVWAFGAVLLNDYLQIAWGSIISAALLGVTEVFVHQYLLKQRPAQRTEKKHRRIRRPHLQFAAEFAEEHDPKGRNKQK